MITGRDEEFKATITVKFNQWLGHDPNASQMAAYLYACENGWTGEDIDHELAKEPESIAYKSRPVLERLHVEGLEFRTASGRPWRMAFADSFRAYERFIKGEDLSAVFQELRDLGANGVRVLGAFDFGSPDQQRLYPGEHPDYYDRLPSFFAFAAQFGFWVQFCVFADTKRSVPGSEGQRAHWTRVCDTVQPIDNVLLQRVNEVNQHDNGLATEVPRPEGICASYGSNGTGDDPPQPFWDYADLGSERRGDFALSTTTVRFAIMGYGTSYPGTHRATVVSEPPGFGEVVTGSRTNNPQIAYLLGLGTKWGAGGCAHSDCGVQSTLLTDTQRVCVGEFIRGTK